MHGTSFTVRIVEVHWTRILKNALLKSEMRYGNYKKKSAERLTGYGLPWTYPGFTET
jgi:hypothetical protein